MSSCFNKVKNFSLFNLVMGFSVSSGTLSFKVLSTLGGHLLLMILYKSRRLSIGRFLTKDRFDIKDLVWAHVIGALPPFDIHRHFFLEKSPFLKLNVV